MRDRYGGESGPERALFGVGCDRSTVLKSEKSADRVRPRFRSSCRPIRRLEQEGRMMRCRLAHAAALVCLCYCLLPGAAWAQSEITGIVTDASGAVLPGVTVEAASPALIEKVRTAVTDAAGRYAI